MKKIIFLSLLFFFSSPLLAQEWVTSIEATYLDYYPEEGRLVAQEKVVFLLEGYRITAHWMEFCLNEGFMEAHGQVRVEGPEVFEGEELEFNLLTMEGILWEGEIVEKEFRLQALQFVFSSDKIISMDSFYTICPHGCDDFYLTARRFELTSQGRLTGYHVYFHLLGVKVFYLPIYWGWIREGRFYPGTPIPYPGFNSEVGPYVDLHYLHWVSESIKGSNSLFLSQEDYFLKLRYLLGSRWVTSLAYGPERSGFLLHCQILDNLNLSLTMQDGENIFLEEEREDHVTFWPSLSLQLEDYPLAGPFSLSGILDYSYIREDEEDRILRQKGALQLGSRRVPLYGHLSWQGNFQGSLSHYDTSSELLSYSLRNTLFFNPHPFFTVRYGHQLVGLHGYTPFLFDDPLPKEDMQGVRTYQDLTLGGRRSFYGVLLNWEVAQGLVEYPLEEIYSYDQLLLGADYRPFPSIRLRSNYSYREVEGIPLLSGDKKTERNNLVSSLEYTLRPPQLPSLTFTLKGDWFFPHEDWDEMTLGIGTAFGRGSDPFQFRISTLYDILEEDWDDDGVKAELLIRTSRFMPYWELGIKGNYNFIEDELKKITMTLSRESPCFYIQVERKREEKDPFWNVSFGTKF